MKTKQLNWPQWKTILLCSLGGALEFYDFIIFAIFAVNIGETFFPSADPLTAALHSFVTFAIGYLARPLGGILFSHFGDRYGRKTTFIVSMSIMALTTFCMSFVPGYESIGRLAPILFILLRFGQGIAIGGEIPGAITYIKENIVSRPGLACGIVFMFINLGIFLADIAYGILHHIASPEYAWRIAFFIGGFLAIISYFLRRTLQETIEFAGEKKRYLVPMFTLLREYFRVTVRAFLIVVCQSCIIALLYLYVPSFMKIHHYATQEITYVTSINLAIFSLACAFWGWTSDFISAQKILFTSAILSMPLALCFYQALIHHADYLMICYAVLAIVTAMYTGSFSAYLANLFSVNVRFSGVAFSYNISFAIFSGLSPLLATYLIKTFGNPMIPAYLFIAGCLLGLVGVLSSKSIHKVD